MSRKKRTQHQNKQPGSLDKLIAGKIILSGNKKLNEKKLTLHVSENEVNPYEARLDTTPSPKDPPPKDPPKE